MSAQEEDELLVAVLLSHPADVLPLFRVSYYLDLFPIRRKAAEWVRDYFETSQQLPKTSLLKRTFPQVNTLLHPPAYHHCLEVLTNNYTESIALTFGEKMTDAMEAKDNKTFIELSQKMTQQIDVATQPLEASGVEVGDFLVQLEARLDKDAASFTKATPSGFKPLDDEDGGGLRPGHIYVIASLINLGKTYVSITIGENIRKAGGTALYYSCEMPKEDICKRSLAVRYGLNVNEFIKQEQPAASIQAGEDKITWVKSMLASVKAIQAQDKATGKMIVCGGQEANLCPRIIRADVAQHSPDVVIIDAGQDLRDDQGTKERTPALYNAVSQLNHLCISQGFAVVVTVQLDPEVEKKGLTKSNLNRVSWGQMWAQKCHIFMTMLGERSLPYREMTVEKSRDGVSSRKFWLSFNFPNVKIEATTQPPGTLADIDLSGEAPETIAELQAALEAAQAPVAQEAPSSPLLESTAFDVPPEEPAMTTESDEEEDPQPKRKTSPSPYAMRRWLQQNKHKIGTRKKKT
jgi:replicative DNA helicase